MKLQLEKARNETRQAILESIESKEAQIRSLEDSINKFGRHNLPSCEGWKNKVATLGALVDQLNERYYELLKPIS